MSTACMLLAICGPTCAVEKRSTVMLCGMRHVPHLPRFMTSGLLSYTLHFVHMTVSCQLATRTAQCVPAPCHGKVLHTWHLLTYMAVLMRYLLASHLSDIHYRQVPVTVAAATANSAPCFSCCAQTSASHAARLPRRHSSRWRFPAGLACLLWAVAAETSRGLLRARWVLGEAS